MYQARSLFFIKNQTKEGGVMARKPNEKIKKAEALYRAGIAMVELSLIHI